MGKDLKGKELGIGITQRKNGTYQGRYKDRFGNSKTIYSKKLKVHYLVFLGKKMQMEISTIMRKHKI